MLKIVIVQKYQCVLRGLRPVYHLNIFIFFRFSDINAFLALLQELQQALDKCSHSEDGIRERDLSISQYQLSMSRLKEVSILNE